MGILFLLLLDALVFHDPVGCRITPPEATLNVHLTTIVSGMVMGYTGNENRNGRVAWSFLVEACQEM